MIGQNQIIIALVVACVYTASGAPQTMIVTQDSRNGLDGLNSLSGLNALKGENGGPVMIVRQSDNNALKGANNADGTNLVSNKNTNAGVPSLPPSPCSGESSGLPGMKCQSSLTGVRGYGSAAGWKSSYVIPPQVIASKSCESPACAPAAAAPSVIETPPAIQPCAACSSDPAKPVSAGYGGYSSSYKHSASSSSSSSEDRYDVTHYGAAARPVSV